MPTDESGEAMDGDPESGEPRRGVVGRMDARKGSPERRTREGHTR